MNSVRQALGYVVPGPGRALLWDWSAPPILAHQKERAKLLVVVKEGIVVV